MGSYDVEFNQRMNSTDYFLSEMHFNLFVFKFVITVFRNINMDNNYFYGLPVLPIQYEISVYQTFTVKLISAEIQEINERLRQELLELEGQIKQQSRETNTKP